MFADRKCHLHKVFPGSWVQGVGGQRAPGVVTLES